MGMGGGGGGMRSAFSRIFRIFSQFLGRSLGVMFKRKHSRGIVHFNQRVRVSGGVHHSNKTAFSAAFSAFSRIFPHFLPIPATASPPPLGWGWG